MPLFLFFPAPAGDGYQYEQIVYVVNPDVYGDDEIFVVGVEAAGVFPDPIAYWSLDNADLVSTTVIDLIGGNNGTNSGATTGEAGQIHQSFLFNGSSDYIDVSNESTFDFDLSDSFSFSAWVNTNTATTSAVFGKFDQLVGSGYTFAVRSSGEIILNLINSLTVGLRVSSTLTINDAVWHHIVATYDGSSTTSGIKLYIDGTEDTQSVVDSTNPGSILNNVNLNIGRHLQSGSGTALFEDNLDELAIWNIELTADQVLEVYRHGAQGLKLVE